MVFTPLAHLWQGWERVIMVPLVRAGTLEKEGLGVGLPEDASIPFPTRHILKSLPLSGPTLTWHTGTCLSPPIHSATSAKPQPPEPDSTLSSSRKLPGTSCHEYPFTLPLIINKSTVIVHILWGRPFSKYFSCSFVSS